MGPPGGGSLAARRSSPAPVAAVRSGAGAPRRPGEAPGERDGVSRLGAVGVPDGVWAVRRREEPFALG